MRQRRIGRGWGLGKVRGGVRGGSLTASFSAGTSAMAVANAGRPGAISGVTEMVKATSVSLLEVRA